MSKDKEKTQNTKPQKTKPPYRSERQPWTVPNTPPAIRPVNRPKPSQNNPKPESPKPEFQPQVPKPTEDKKKE